MPITIMPGSLFAYTNKELDTTMNLPVTGNLYWSMCAHERLCSECQDLCLHASQHASQVHSNFFSFHNGKGCSPSTGPTTYAQHSSLCLSQACTMHCFQQGLSQASLSQAGLYPKMTAKAQLAVNRFLSDTTASFVRSGVLFTKSRSCLHTTLWSLFGFPVTLTKHQGLLPQSGFAWM
mgnify:FL=1